ncbi:MAG: hypothetical protein H8E15_14060 [Planctomycetes bacterium]|nr:hypothetical protein [Planctomycetota bacterium]
MISIVTSLLVCAAVQAPSEENAIREMAWNLHCQQPSAAKLLLQWQQAAPDHALLMPAISRSLAGTDSMKMVLVEILQASEAAAPTPEVIQYLAHSPATADAIPLLLDLFARPAWQAIAGDTLLRWGVMPADEKHALASHLMQKLLSNWVPPSDSLASILGLGDAYRAAVFPLLFRFENLTLQQLQNLKQLDSSNFSPFDSALLDVFLLHQQSQLAASIHDLPASQIMQNAWLVFLEDDLALGQRQLLEVALQQYSHHVSADDFHAALQQSGDGAALRALQLFHQTPMPCGVDLLLDHALNAQAVSEARSKSVASLFKVSPDASLKKILPLLKPEQDKAILRAMLAGLRMRPLDLIPGTIETLLPKLRTKDASLAMEVLILTADHSTRLQWLPKVAALPENSGRRLMEMAWGVDPSSDLVAEFRALSSDSNVSKRALGAAGLIAALSEQDVADHYEVLLKGATEPALFDEYLDVLRDLRSDAALEVILDWLITPGGRQNPRSGAFASMLIEEAAATRMFMAWWSDRSHLSESQIDWAACHLASTDATAMQRLRERIGDVPARTQTMMLSRMKDSAGPEEVDLWNFIMQDFGYEVGVRRVAAHLLYRQAAEQEVEVARKTVQPSLGYFFAANSDRVMDRAWLVFIRGLAGYKDMQWRRELLDQMRALPVEYRLAFVKACFQGYADQPLEEQREVLQSELLLEAIQPSTALFRPTIRPKFQEVSAAHFEFFHRVIALQALKPTPQQDQKLASELHQLGAKFHPDRLSILPVALTDWPLTSAKAKEILMASEDHASFRRPPLEQDQHVSPMASYIDAMKFFEELQKRYDSGRLHQLQNACDIACYRWPRDRRSFIWSGWVAVSEGRLQDAQAAFEQALLCSGWLSYVQMEPRLGMAVTSALANQDWDTLQTYLQQNDQTDALLAGRILHGLLPELEAVLTKLQDSE